MATGGNSEPPFPESIADRTYKVPNVDIKPKDDNEKELIVNYIYSPEEGDVVTYELLKSEKEKEKGVYARFLVVRSAATKTHHLLHTSSFIPDADSLVIIKEKVVRVKEKKKSFYRVQFKKSKGSGEMTKYFTPRNTSSSDEEKS